MTGTLAAQTGHAPEVVIDLLRLLLRARADTLSQALQAVLERLGAITGADRVFLLTLEGESWSCVQDWAAPGLPGLSAALTGRPRAGVSGLIDGLRAHRPLTPPPTHALNPGPLRDLLSELGISVLLGAPFTGDDNLAGMIGLARCGSSTPFTTADLELLDTLSEGVNGTLERAHALTNLTRARTDQARTLERLRATLAAMPELLLEVDANGIATDWHCAAPGDLASCPDQILGRTLEETLPPDIAALQRRAMADALRDGVARIDAYPLEVGGQQRRYRLTVARRAALADSPPGFVFRIRDITADHARGVETALLGDVTRQMTNMALILDTAARVVWVNPAFEARSGYSLDELRGLGVADLPRAPETDPAVLARIGAAMAAREPIRVELAKRDRAGTLYWVDVSIQPRTAPDGLHLGFIVIETETTERQHHLRDLERLARDAETAHARLHDAIAALQDGFVLFDRDDRLVMCNRRYREINADLDDILVPGVTYAEIVRAGRDRGLYRSTPQMDSFMDDLAAGRAVGMFRGEIPYANGRVYRTFASRTSDGGHVGLRSDITEIRAAEARLDDIIRSARIGTWELDLGAGTIRLGGRWPRLRGVPDTAEPVEIRVADWLAILHPDDHAAVAGSLNHLDGIVDDTAQLEFRLRHVEGFWNHLLLRGRVQSRDALGKPVRLRGISLDITRRRQAEERLSEILRAAQVGTWTLDAATGRVTIDEPYAEMLGHSCASLAPMTQTRFESMLHPEDLQVLRQRLARMHPSDGDSIAHEFRIRHRNGHWVWVLSKARVLAWATDGTPARQSGLHLDITHSKESAAALARAMSDLEHARADRAAAEQRLADIAAVSDNWFWEMDPTGRFTFVSDGFTRVTGLPVTRLQGRTLAEAGACPVEGDVGLCADPDAATRDCVWRLDPAPGTDALWLRISGARFDDGQRHGLRGVGTDVSALIRATETAQSANHAKSRFLANMSHELRTPLTGVLGMADLLGETRIDTEQRKMLDTIRASGEGLLAILNDILDLAKIEAGKMTLEENPYRPADLLQRVGLLFDAQARAAGLTLHMDLDPACPQTVSGDANRLLQVLTNLVGNAIKFTETGGVAVRLDCESADTLRLTVTDTGIGMTEEQAQRVFDEFEQAEGSTARRFGGTGLGLSITRRLVRLMGGEIALRTAPARGTTVTVILPLRRPQAGAAPVTRALAPDLGGLRVLVADDTATNRQILHSMLSGLGLQVSMASDGTEAVAGFRPGGFDAVLLDISMPGLDGPAALAAIRRAEGMAGAPPVPALAVTANAMEHQVADYLAAGFAGHVAKPFRKADLARALAEIVPRRQNAAE